MIRTQNIHSVKAFGAFVKSAAKVPLRKAKKMQLSERAKRASFAFSSFLGSERADLESQPTSFVRKH
jgi:hypothetical protein